MERALQHAEQAQAQPKGFWASLIAKPQQVRGGGDGEVWWFVQEGLCGARGNSRVFAAGTAFACSRLHRELLQQPQAVGFFGLIE
jgi:hypothetical protein